MTDATAAEHRKAAAAKELQRISPYSWFVLGMLCLIYVFNFLDRQLFATLGVFIAKDMSLTDADLGKLGGIYFAAFYTIIGIPVGWLADRTNRVRILTLACTIWSAATAGCGFSTNFMQLAISRMTIGVGEAGGAPPSYSIISDYFPAEQRGQALAIFSFGVPLGQAAAVAFGVKVAHEFGWAMAFKALGVMGIIAGIALITLVREPKRGSKDVKIDYHMDEAPPISLAEEKAKFLPTMREFFGRPAMLFTALSCGSAAFVAYGILNFTVPLLTRQKHIGDDSLALWYSVELAFIGSLGVWLSGILVAKLRSKGKAWYAIVPGIAQLVVIPFYLAFVNAPTWQLGIAFLAIPVLLNTFYLAPALAVVQNSMKPSQRTMAGALLLLVLNLIGLGLGPTFVGMMSTDIFLPRLTADFAALGHGAAAGADLAAIKAHGLQLAMFSLAPFYLIAMVFHFIAAYFHRKETQGAKPTEAQMFSNAILVKFAIGIIGIAVIWYFGPAILWFKYLIYAAFSVFLVLGVVDLVRGNPFKTAS